MALYGNLRTFPITDLLQWVENARKSGVLSVEYDRVSKKVVFRGGRVAACSSNDPPTLLGQALLAKGRISEAVLRQALAHQETAGGNLGAILVEMGAVTSEDVIGHVAAKAEETLYSLFDWEDAEFQFHEDGPMPEHTIEVDLRIQDVLLRGLQRFDEMTRIREVFPNRHVVLERTDKPVPPKVVASRVASRILESVNGERTLAELLFHTRGSEYLVSKFLFELHRQGLVRINEVRTPAPVPESVAVHQSGISTPAPSAAADGQVHGGSGGSANRTSGGLASEVEVAQSLLARNEPDAALAVLSATSRAYPGVPTVGQLIQRAETAYMETASRELDASKVPVVVAQHDPLATDDLPPGEAYMLTVVDGASDIKSILWLAPMRSVEVMRALRGLMDKGVVELCDPA